MFFFIYKKQFLKLLVINFSYLTFLFCLIHNYYFGDSLSLFSNAFNSKNFPLSFNEIIRAFISLLSFNFYDANFLKFLNHFLWWNPIYNTHRLFIIFIIIAYLFKKKQDMLLYILTTCAFLQHSFLFISDPSSRYAYLAWFLTIIIFLKINYDNKLIENIYKKIKSK